MIGGGCLFGKMRGKKELKQVKSRENGEEKKIKINQTKIDVWWANKRI